MASPQTLSRGEGEMKFKGDMPPSPLQIISEVNKKIQTSYDVLFKIPNDTEHVFFYGCYGYLCNKKFREFVIKLGTEWFINNDYTIELQLYGYAPLTTQIQWNFDSQVTRN